MILPDVPAKVIAYYIAARAWAVWADQTGSWKMSVNKMPDLTTEQIAIPWVAVYDLKADESSVRLRTGVRSEFWGWQVLVRGKTDDDATGKLGTIGQGFDDLYLAPVSIGANNYTIQRIRRTSQPLFLKQEERANMRIWTMSGFASIYLQGS